MKYNLENYCQYLIAEHKNYTLTNLAEQLKTYSHDSISRFLSSIEITPETIWINVVNEIQISSFGFIIFDDTVINKKYSKKIELVKRQYSGNEHKTIRGIGLVNCLYVNPITREFWLINYRIYAPEIDNKTKLDHVSDMLKDLVYQKKLAFNRVLMDTWYAAQKIMTLIDELGKIYYCPLKTNRLVDDSGGVLKYKRVSELIWNDEDLDCGKLIKIKNFPAHKKVKFFRVTISTNRTEYIATNDLTQDSTNNVYEISRVRWKIEEFHRELKQLTGIESCQCRKEIIQRNHIGCAILVWNYLKKISKKLGKTTYQIKHNLLKSYLQHELRSPSIPMRLVS